MKQVAFRDQLIKLCKVFKLRQTYLIVLCQLGNVTASLCYITSVKNIWHNVYILRRRKNNKKPFTNYTNGVERYHAPRLQTHGRSLLILTLCQYEIIKSIIAKHKMLRDLKVFHARKLAVQPKASLYGWNCFKTFISGRSLHLLYIKLIAYKYLFAENRHFRRE